MWAVGKEPLTDEDSTQQAQAASKSAQSIVSAPGPQKQLPV